MAKHRFLNPLFFTVFLLCLSTGACLAASREIAIDAVVASVDGQPIAMSDVAQRLGTDRKWSLSEAAADPAFRQALDGLVMEQLVNEEAKNRKLDVSDAEISQYVSEVAARNNLSVEGFERALTQEKRSLTAYKQQVRLDILRGKLMSNVNQGAPGVSEDEIDKYLTAHPEVGQAGTKITLRQIFFSISQHTFEQAKEFAEKAKARLEDGDDFEDVAREMSEGPEAADGGLLGTLAEEELSQDIFDAVFNLQEETDSAVTVSDRGFHIFRIDKRSRDEQKSKEIRDQVRAQLQQQKAQNKAQNFFLSELYRSHSVDKKI